MRRRVPVPTVFLHIGLHKTGTTALQKFLTENSTVLRQHQALYPEAGRHVHNPFGQHNLPWSLIGHLIGRRQGVEASAWNDLIEEIHAKDPAKVIVSTEEFEAMPLEYVRRVRDILSGYDVRILVYLRNPTGFMQSAFKQQIKSNLRYARSFRDFVDRNIHRCAYPQVLDRWSEAFGREAINVRCYDALRSRNGLFEDFCQVVGLTPMLMDCEIPTNGNVSPSDEQTAVLRLLNRIWWRAEDLPRFRRSLGRYRQSVVRQDCMGKALTRALGSLLKNSVIIPTNGNVSLLDEQTAVLWLLNRIWWKAEDLPRFRRSLDRYRRSVLRRNRTGKALTRALGSLLKNSLIPTRELDRIGDLVDPVNEDLFPHWFADSDRAFLLSSPTRTLSALGVAESQG